MDFPTYQDLFRVARDRALADSPRLTVEEVEREGSDTNILLAASAAVGDECIGQLARVSGALYLDSARGLDLERLVFDRFGLVRKAASNAIGEVEFSTTTATTLPLSIPANTMLSTDDGKQFATVYAVAFPVGTTGPVTAVVRSVLAGSDQQAKMGTITGLLSSLTNQPTDLEVTNSKATFGADDEETDDSLRARARDFWTSARRGTITAVRNGALAVPGVRSASVIEDVDTLGRPRGPCSVIVTDAFTDALLTATPTPTSYMTQSAAFATDVARFLEDYRAVGVYVGVTVAQVVVQTVSLNLHFRAGVDTSLVAEQARAIVVNTVNALAPGETLTIDAINAALARVSGLSIAGGEVAYPAGDVVPKSLQVIRTSMSLVTEV